MTDYIVTLYSGKMDGMLFPIRNAVDEEDALNLVAAATNLQLVRFKDPNANDTEVIGFAQPEEGKDLAAMMAEDMMSEGAPRWWWQAWIEEIQWGQNHPEAVCW